MTCREFDDDLAEQHFRDLVRLEKAAYADVPAIEPLEQELLVVSILLSLYGRSS